MATNQPTFEINVKRNDRNLKFDVSRDTTGLQLRKMVAEREGLSLDAVELIWGGRKLDDKATINEANLQDGTIVQLIFKAQKEIPPPPPGTFKIFVTTPTNNSHTLDVDASTSVSQFRLMVQDKTAVEPEHQRLIHGGKDLQDEHHESHEAHTLGEYAMKAGDTVHMVLRLPGGGRGLVSSIVAV